MIKVAVMGYGTVGSGVVEIFDRNKETIAERVGEEIKVKYILDLRDFPGTPIENKVVHELQVILEDPEITVVVETMGGVEPARTFVEKALLSGKSVVTSNKDLVARWGASLMATAREHKVSFLFEASVGGGIPIIRPLNTALTGDEIEEITGILNGTTNFILTKMNREGKSFEDVLEEAKELGYAERNPTSDVDGFDACRKIAILTSLVTGRFVDYEDLYTEGIAGITSEDFLYAKALKKSIKLFGTCKKVSGGFYAMVAPVMIGEDHPLYGVNDVFNGILVKGNMVGNLMFYGAGAGKLATASAVVADVIDTVKNAGRHIACGWSEKKLPLASWELSEKPFFVRLEGERAVRAGEVKTAFGEVEYIEPDGLKEFGVITKPMSEAAFARSVKTLAGVKNRIRMEA